jgi:hypothetical protein
MGHLFIMLGLMLHAAIYSVPKQSTLEPVALKNYALIKYPVVDLFGSATFPDGPLPASTRTHVICPRINQGLFNEVFEIEQVGPHSTAIIIPWAIYGYDSSGKPQNRYWVATKNLLTLSAIPTQYLKEIPLFNSSKNNITLKRPFSAPDGVTYSIGTQFALKRHDASYAYVSCFDTATAQVKEYAIPKSRCIMHEKNSRLTGRQKFIQLLTGFIDEVQQHFPKNTIAYIWGGSSFTRSYTPEYYEDASGFHRTEQDTGPLSGYDCSNLVLRFAHMAHVPYYFKTTSMLEKYGKKFTDSDILQEGDLIWLQGHVVIISNLADTLVTESCGYENFVGKVQTIRLSQLLKGINTWQDLLDAYRHNKPVMRLDAHGNNYKESPVKIFKLI